jgi:hypothetical protein
MFNVNYLERPSVEDILAIISFIFRSTTALKEAPQADVHRHSKEAPTAQEPMVEGAFNSIVPGLKIGSHLRTLSPNEQPDLRTISDKAATRASEIPTTSARRRSQSRPLQPKETKHIQRRPVPRSFVLELIATDVDSVEYVTVNSDNTLIAAVVSQSNAKGNSISELRMWDAGEGNVLWRRQYSQVSQVLPASFCAGGQYFCFYDGVGEIVGIDTKDELLLEEPLVDLSSDESLEFGVDSHPQLISFAVNSGAKRIALAVSNYQASSQFPITLKKAEINSTGGRDVILDQVYVPITSMRDIPCSTLLCYTEENDILFVVWQGITGVLITTINVKTQQIIGRHEYEWDLRGNWITSIQVYGCTQVKNENCLVLTIPSKVRKGLFGRMLGQRHALGFATLAVNIMGQEIARLDEFEGKQSKQFHDLTISDGKIVRFEWSRNGQGMVKMWEGDHFQSCYQFLCDAIASRGDKFVYQPGRLTLLSSRGRIKNVPLTPKRSGTIPKRIRVAREFSKQLFNCLG